MQQGYLRHIGFGPDVSCLVLFCAALLRCPLAQHCIGFGFSHSSMFRPGPEPPHQPNLLLFLVLLLCPALPVVDGLFSPPYGLLSVMVVCLLEQQTSFVPSLPPSN